MPDRAPSDLTDEELLEAILTSGAQPMHQAQQKIAEMGSLTDDHRWEAPAPLRFEIQLATRPRRWRSRRGAHPKAIQARMGHASITTTLNLYGHLFPSLDVELADRLDAARAERLAARVRRAGGPDVVPIDTARR